MVRLYRFDLERGRVDVETLSPWLLGKRPDQRNQLEQQEVELTDHANRFSVALDFDQRFAGFAPIPPRAERPAADLVIPGTVAYWRFDGVAGDGAPVATGATIADASGHGNDLTVVRLDNSGPSALTAIGDHHVDQPAHASLFIDGGYSPTRGAYLRTADAAPLNRLRFERGYTLEAFMKIPRTYNDGTHDWRALGGMQDSSAWFADSPGTGSNAIHVRRFRRHRSFGPKHSAGAQFFSRTTRCGSSCLPRLRCERSRRSGGRR